MCSCHTFGHVPDFQIIDKSSEEEEQAKYKKYPPKPILSIEVASKIVREPDNKDPLDQREAESTDGAIPSGYGVGDAEGHTEAKPVEDECHEKGQQENAVVTHAELIGIAEVVSRWALFLLNSLRCCRRRHGSCFGLLSFVIGGKGGSDTVGRRHRVELAVNVCV